MAVEDMRAQLDTVADEFKDIHTDLKAGVLRLRVVNFSVGRIAAGVRTIRPASVSRAAGDIAKEVFFAGEPIASGASLLRSVVDTDTANPNAQHALFSAENAERLLDGDAAVNGSTLPEAQATIAHCAQGIQEHADAVLDRIEAMKGRIAMLREALGEVASGPVGAARQSTITYRNQV